MLLAVMSLLLMAAAPVMAKGRQKPGGGGDSGSTITLDQPQPVYHGDTISFSVTTSATDRPIVALKCYKNGGLVYSSAVGMFQQYIDEFGDPVFVLSSRSWESGSADCTAELQYQHRNGRMRALASMSFAVLG